MSNDIRTLYDHVLQQMAAEVYLEDVGLSNNAQVTQALNRGNNRPGFTEKGFVRFADRQADGFISKFQVIDQLSDDPNSKSVRDNTGLSATLIKTGANSYTLSIRSTEYRNANDGGDFQRDTSGGAGRDISNVGFAFAQLDSLEKYYAHLKSLGKLPSDATLTVTGYSLGGHLATVFTELHAEVSQTYLFNAAGRGGLSASAPLKPGFTLNSQLVLNVYRAVLSDPNAWTNYFEVTAFDFNDPEYVNARGVAITPQTFTATATERAGSIYSDPRHVWALEVAGKLTTTLASATGVLDLVTNAKITEIYGHATHDDTEGVSALGIHASSDRRVQIFIEDQPAFSGLGGFFGLPGDFGNTHSIALIADSLALMGTMLEAQPALSKEDMQAVFASASNARASGVLFAAGKAEGDSLENVLDALRRLFVSSEIVPTKYDNKEGGFGSLGLRNRFHDNLSELKEKIRAFMPAGGGTLAFTIVPLVPASGFSSANGEPSSSAGPYTSETLIDLAKRTGYEGAAYRYALKNLNPFAVLASGGTFAPYESAELKRYDAGISPEGMTDAYLQARVEMVYRRLYITMHNEALYPGDPSVPVNTPMSFAGESTYYEDRANRTRIGQSGNPNGAQRLLFGADNMSDVLEGRAQADKLFGGGSSDILTGGKGNDYLEGGAGMDAYRLNLGDGEDTILDADGKGSLIRGDITLALAIKQSETQWVLGTTTYTKTTDGKDLEITFADTSDKITVKGFDFARADQDGYLGIRLVDSPAAPTISRTLTGDLNPIDTNPSQSGEQFGYDLWGNVLTASETVVRSDALYGRDDSEGDWIQGGGDNDIIFGDATQLPQAGPRPAPIVSSATGGADRIEAGAGRDMIVAGAGNDLIEGGTEGDIALAGAGDDRLYGQDNIALDAAILTGDSGVILANTGELLAGGSGDDVIVGGATADLVLGGVGRDVIVAGVSDDTVYGDLDLTSASLDWSIERTHTKSDGVHSYNVTFSNAQTQEPQDAMLGQADAIYGGGGADWVFAGGGDDYVDGGSGDDVLLGEGGSDVLIGGAGNDFIAGDSTAATAAGLAGDDYLDGGTGDDILVGEAGNDILYGGTGDDVLSGGDGADILFGGAGADVLAGGAGKDTYIFYRGDGVEVVSDTPAGADDPEASVLILGEGISRSDVRFRLGSLMVDLGHGDVIHFEGFDSDDLLSTPVLESIHFADGTSVSYQDVLDQGFDLDGTEGDDLIEGTAVTDRIDGKGGNDRIIAKAGNDVIFGGEGDDDIDAGTGDDVIDAGAGQDVVDAGEGDDTVTTGGGGDIVYGSAGNDTVNAQDGDLIVDLEGTNYLDLTAYTGLTAANLEITQYEAPDGETYLNFHVYDELNPGATPDTGGVSLQRGELGSFATVTVNDGTGGTVTLSHESLMDNYAAHGFAYRGTEAADTLAGTPYEDVLLGGAGMDTLQGGAGDDKLDGGRGDDMLVGGAGNDTYLLAFNGGRDMIIEEGLLEPNATHTIRLDAGLSFSLVKAQRVGDDLEVRSLRATADALVIKDYYVHPSSWQEGWQVKDGEGNAADVAEFLPEASVPVPPETWLDEQKEVFRIRREQVYNANQHAMGYVAIEDGEYRRVTSGFRYSESVNLSTTTTRSLNVDIDESNSGSVVANTFVSNSFQGSTQNGIEIARPVAAGGYQAGRGAVSSSFGNAGSASGGQGEFIPVAGNFPGFNGAGVRLEPGDVAMPVYAPRIGAANTMREASVGSYAEGGGFENQDQWHLIGFRVYRANGSVPIEDGAFGAALQGRVASVNVNEFYEQVLRINDIEGGDSNQNITAQDASLIYAGAGDDNITLGAGYLLAGPDWQGAVNLDHLENHHLADFYGTQARYQESRPNQDGLGYLGGRSNSLGGFADGGAGDDTIRGSIGQDVISGGEGADVLEGNGGSDRYLFAAGESGYDTLSDAELDALSYLDWYYWNRDVLHWDESAAHGGEYRVFDDALHYFSSLEAIPPSWRENAEYVQPLPSAAPVITRNDTALIEQLTQAGVISEDVVEFGPGITLEDLGLTIYVDDASAAEHLEQPWHMGGTLRVRWDNAGFDVEVPDVNYGFVGSSLTAIEHLDLDEDGEIEEEEEIGAWTGYRLGEGIEAFQFVDGTKYSLEEILQRATIVHLLGDYAFTRDSGQQIISRNYTAVVFEDGINADEVVITRDGVDLLLTLSDDSTQGRIEGWYSTPASVPFLRLRFSEDIDIDAVALTRTGLVVTGTEGDDVLAGLNGFDNTLIGGEGSDTYFVGMSGSADRVEDVDAEGDDIDVVRFASGVRPYHFTVVDDSDDIVLQSRISNDSIRLVGAADTQYGIERFEFGGGLSLTLQELRDFPEPVVLVGTDEDDFLEGSTSDDVVIGLGGSDYLLGYEGNDILAGGAGDDYLDGGVGNDVFLFDPNDGRDVIFDEGGADSIRFADGVLPDNVIVTREDAAHIVLSLTGSESRILLADWFDESYRVETAEFANGTLWSAADLMIRIIMPPATPFDDMLVGTDEVDVINALDGNDVIYGLGGDDVLDGAAGSDYMEGGAGNDILRGGDVSDGLSDSAGNNFLDGGTGDDNISVGDSDGLNSGSSFIIGGTGDDEINSYDHGNVIAFNAGDGHDVVNARNAVTLSLGGGIQPDWLSLSLDGIDLVLSIGENDSIRLTSMSEDVPEVFAPITLQMFGSVHIYDFNAVIQAFYDELAQNPSLESFPLDGVLQEHETAFSETQALGGALAWQYGTMGGLEALADSEIRRIVMAPGFGTETQNIEPTAGNQAPVLAIAVTDQTATEDASFTSTLARNTFEDPDADDTLRLSTSLEDGSPLPEWLSFDIETGTFSGTPDNDQVGTLSVQIMATDSEGFSASDTFDLTIENVNDAPALGNPVADQSANAGTAFNFTVAANAFNDIDQDDSLSLDATLADGAALPAWLSFNAATWAFSGTPAVADTGTLSVRVTATDEAGAAATDDFQLTVTAIPQGIFLEGTRGDDVLIGAEFEDFILSKGGDDKLYGRGGNDLLNGGRGHDRLYGENGDDVLVGGKGEDWLEGGIGNDMLDGGQGKDDLAGGAGDDLLAGGEDNDNLQGGSGNDLYIHEKKGGHDIIEETEGQDILRFGEGISTNKVKLYRSRDDLLVDLTGSDGSVTIKGWFASDAKKAERIEFANGTVWNVNYIRDHLQRGSAPKPGHDDDDHGHHYDRVHHHGKGGRKRDDDHADNDSRHERGHMADLLEAYLAHKPRYDFEKLASDIEQGGERREHVLNALEIANRWQRVGRYVNGLSDERDEDARHGAREWSGFDALNLLGGGSSGGAFGHSGSTGAKHGVVNLKTLQGLEEGFRRLHR